jgi:hypothetical protein
MHCPKDLCSYIPEMERMSARGLSNTSAGFSGRHSAILYHQIPVLQQYTKHTPRRSTSKRGVFCYASLEGNLVRSKFPGFDDDVELTLPKSTIVTPESASWGLSVSQMRAMGITSESERKGELDPVRPSLPSWEPSDDYIDDFFFTMHAAGCLQFIVCAGVLLLSRPCGVR